MKSITSKYIITRRKELVNPVVAILLLICASIVIAGIFVIPTGIIGWILRRIYLYLTK